MELSHLDFIWPDVFRVTFVVLALLLVGTNLAFVRWSRYIFSPESCTPWRFFFLGKTMVTLSVALLVWQRASEGFGISPATYIAAVGVVMSNIALGVVYKRRNELLDHVVTVDQAEAESH